MVESRPVGINQRVVGSPDKSGWSHFIFPMSAYWTYILQNPDGRFYVGSSQDLVERLKSHNDIENPRGKYTRKNGPWELVWSERHATRASAMKREREVKAKKSAKWIREQLLNGRVPTRRD